MSVHAISWVLKNSEAQYGARLVLIVLADHADADGRRAYPSVATIAREAKLEDRQVQRVLVELCETGRINRQGLSSFGTAVYDIVMVDGIAADVAAREGRDNLSPPTSVAAAGDISARSGVADVAQTVPSNRKEPSGARLVFTAWVEATNRDPKRTKLTPDRRSVIERAVRSHGLDDCLTAVRNIGLDKWARGDNDRGRRYDDIKHALANGERIERWRDWKPTKSLAARMTPTSGKCIDCDTEIKYGSRCGDCMAALEAKLTGVAA